jgi:hypothetical protein
MGNFSSTSSTPSPHITTSTELLYSSGDDKCHNQRKRASQPIKSNNPSTRAFPPSSSHTKLHYGSDDDSSSHNQKRKVSRLPVEIGSSSKDTSSFMSQSPESYQGSSRVENSAISLSPSSSDESDVSLTMIRNHSKCITNHSKPNSSTLIVFGSDSEDEAVDQSASIKSTQKRGKKFSSKNEDDEDYELDESADSDADTEEVMKKILDHAHLVDMSFFSELQNYLIGIKEMKTSAIKTLYGRVSSFLGFVMNENNLKDSANRICTQEEAIKILLEGDINVIERYIQVLKLDNNRRVGTCYNIVLDIKHWLDYMKVHENKQISAVIEFYMKLLRNLMKKKRKDLKKRLNRSELEKNLKFPKGGKKELIEIFEKKAPRVDNILQKLRKDDQAVSDKDRIFAYYWIVTHVFLHNPQARVGAITTMSVEDMDMLRTDEYTTSTHFKTSDTYGSQVILCHKVTLYYIEAYLTLLRPWLSTKNKDSEPSQELFLSLRGKQSSNVGVCVTRLFEKISKYHITTNGLRTIFETDITEAAMTNVITNEEKDFVARHNNHSSTCAWNHYQKCNSVKAALATKKTHKTMYGEPSLPIKTLKLEDYDETYVPVEFSQEETKPTSARKRSRVDWTSEELMHLNNWANYHTRKHGLETKKDWGKCVKALEKYECFHSSHLEKEKLREAYKRLQSNM